MGLKFWDRLMCKGRTPKSESPNNEAHQNEQSENVIGKEKVELLDCPKSSKTNAKVLKSTDSEVSSGVSESQSKYGKTNSKRSNEEMLNELDSLSSWSQCIQKRNVLMSTYFPKIKQLPITICKEKDISQSSSTIYNAFVTPLDYESGSFRKTKVTLRKCVIREMDPMESTRIIEEGMNRDCKILSEIKHSNIILLMAASVSKEAASNIMVLESVDCTLHYFIHQMGQSISVIDSIQLVQQIASASLYLKESGYIHSNISSHSVLVRCNPWCVKLSSFELTTKLNCSDIQREILNKFGKKLVKERSNNNSTEEGGYASIHNSDKLLKNQYRKLSQRPEVPQITAECDVAYNLPSKYLVYNVFYRQHFSLYNYQAPELLGSNSQFVFPTQKVDVYSLCILLWEILNKCVPFVVYSRKDMKNMIANNNFNLPIFELQRCKHFSSIFQVGFEIHPLNRRFNTEELINMLEHVLLEIRRNNLKTLEDNSKGKEGNGNEQSVKPTAADAAMLAQISSTTSALLSSLLSSTISTSFASSTSSRVPSLSSLSIATEDGNVSANVINDVCDVNSTIDFNKCLSDGNRTSTLKKSKKSADESAAQLFNESNDNDGVDSNINLNENLDALDDDGIIENVSGCDLSSIQQHSPLFNLPSEKLTICVTLNMKQIEGRSANVNLNDDSPPNANPNGESPGNVNPNDESSGNVNPNDESSGNVNPNGESPGNVNANYESSVNPDICGSKKALVGLRSKIRDEVKYVCYKCVSLMSPDEFKEFRNGPIANYPTNMLASMDEFLEWACCQASAEHARSIEDLYIDDDYLYENGRGVNLELLSDSSDSSFEYDDD